LLGTGFGLLAGRPSTLGGSSTGPEVTPTDTVTPTPTFAPTIPPAALAVRNVSSPLPASLNDATDATIRVLASCAPGEQLLGGGYALDGSVPLGESVLAVQGSYPSDSQGNPVLTGPASNSWTVVIVGPPRPRPPGLTRL